MNREVESPESHLDHGCKERLVDYFEQYPKWVQPSWVSL